MQDGQTFSRRENDCGGIMYTYMSNTIIVVSKHGRASAYLLTFAFVQLTLERLNIQMFVWLVTSFCHSGIRSCSPRSCSPSPAVWEKLFSRNRSPKDHSMSSSREVFLAEVVLREVVLLEVVLREVVLRKLWHSRERFLTAQAPKSEGGTPTFSTRIENQDHADGLPNWGPMIIINK